MIVYCKCGAGRPGKPGEHRYGETVTLDSCPVCADREPEAPLAEAPDVEVEPEAGEPEAE